MVKSNIQNKSSATNAHPPGPQATLTSVGESPDSLNLISCASSRAGKHVHPRGHSRARHTVRRSSRSVLAAEVSRNVSLLCLLSLYQGWSSATSLLWWKVISAVCC